ncbi:hypothetical protein B7R22_16810 [Subtercola boreus]|uniref:ABC transporter domain-containing protein n=1 Tax=Subtercola boreus TaxID=120213 RepID=A0A3E0VR36_9MICO|nr:ATP-binding cassette domain-containing protein [Subtercola boreus]RFA12095.1 hypothetical protein B7R22_16810 [Subtercola boreus]
MQEILRVDGLTRRFGGVTALDNLSFTMTDGEKLAIIGPNGAGKSTLLKLIAGQDRASAGSIWLDGQGQVEKNSAHEMTRSGIALARQVPRPLGSLTVSENIRIGVAAGRSRSEVSGAQRLEQVLELSGLARVRNRVAGTLPLLDLKRLEVAKALSSSPRIILLDEVSAGLNEVELDAAIDLISSIHAAGTSIMLVEHVQRVIHRLADRVLVLNWGALLAEGTPAEVTANDEVRRVYLGAGRPAESDRVATVTTSPQVDRRATDGGLAISGLKVRRGRLVVLEDVSFTVTPGEVVAVLGSNGAGKTTLAQSISGILRSDTGLILWDGTDIAALSSAQRARLGIAHCQEGRKLFPGMTVRQNLELGGFGQSARELRTRAADVFDLFPMLAERSNQIATTMSGGQQQLLAIGRALMGRPKLILCDEVTLGLSPKVADEIYIALRSAAAQGTSLVLVEQDAARCLSVATHAYVLARGRVVYDGPSRDLTDDILVKAYLSDDDESSAPTGGPSVTKVR